MNLDFLYTDSSINILSEKAVKNCHYNDDYVAYTSFVCHEYNTAIANICKTTDEYMNTYYAYKIYLSLKAEETSRKTCRH